jgi:hypothetical protein
VTWQHKSVTNVTNVTMISESLETYETKSSNYPHSPTYLGEEEKHFEK